MKRQSLYFTAPGEVSIVEEAFPAPAAGEVVVQAIYSAISPGTELLFYRGQFPRDMVLDESIPALHGAASYPLKYGYSIVGRVIEVGARVDNGWLDRMVFAFHPHESYFTADTGGLMPIPEGLSLEEALFLPNMETAVNFTQDGAPLLGENVLVVGQGVVGLLTTAVLARFPLDNLVTLDYFANRRQASREMGANASLAPEELQQVKSALPGGADLTYELSGSPAGLDTAIALTGYAGRVVIGSWYGEKEARLDLGGHFHRSRIRMLSSQVSSLAPALSARWTKARRMDVAWRMLLEIQPSRLVSRRVPIHNAHAAYRELDQQPDEVIQTIFTYD